MGVVYEARQAGLGRVVAVKVMRGSGFATEPLRRRFRNEAEAVARFDHPHIVPVYEVGRAGGLDYFSMKRVEGAALDAVLADYADDPRDAVRLVAAVADAIHHAHLRGILHRDLKPANILVDDRGEPHVTDFGLARSVESASDLTRTGCIVGTPSYMAPEQADADRGGVTTATAVYGLGAVFYALLTGRAPHVGDGLFAILAKVRSASPEPPSRLNRRVPRALDRVCLKCLEADPRRRYESARAFADDLRRWLRGEPIAARPACPWVRMALWCRRRPLPAALAAALAVATTVGAAGIAWKWQEAEREAATSAEVVGALRRIFLAPANGPGGRGAAPTVRELLDREAALVGGHFQGRPRAEAAIRAVIGDAYLGLGEPALALPHLQEAVRLDRERLGASHPTVPRAANRLALALDGVGRSREAESLARRTLQASDLACGPVSPTSLEAADGLGWILRGAGRFAEAEPFLRRALDGRRRVLPAGHPDILHSVRRLCLLDLDLARYDEAGTLADEYEHGIRCAHGPNHPEVVSALTCRGLVLARQGRPDLATPYFRRAADEARRILGPGHQWTTWATAELARVTRAEPATGPKDSVVPRVYPAFLER
jgi:tetratricopeptide (TPR) repeat protein